MSAPAPPPSTPAPRRSLLADVRRAASLIRPEATRYAGGLLSLFGVNVCDVAAPLLLTVAIDSLGQRVGLPAAPPPPLLALLGLDTASWTVANAMVVYFVLLVAANALRYPMLMLIAVPSHEIGQRLRNALVERFFQRSLGYYDKAKSGDLMALATADVLATRMMFGPGILIGADAVMIVALVIVVMMSLSWKLTLIAMIPLPLIALLTNSLSHAEYNRFEDVQRDLAKLTERARESFAGLRVLQAYAREPFDIARFAEASERHLALQVRLARVKSVFGPSLDLMTGLSMALVVIFGGREVVAGAMSVGTFVAFLFLVGFLSGPMMGFGWAVSLIQRGRASLSRLDAFLAEPPDAPTGSRQADTTALGRLELHNVTFSYAGQDRPALEGISVVVEPGTTLGVIGPVGAGKSTLAKLLVRLYEPGRGQVRVNGVDVLDIDPDALRQCVALAPQETFLFSDTVARNIGLSPRMLEPAERYAERACLHDEVLALPRRYETLLGERGLMLSGGQRQRLAIARTLAAETPVVVLDDCLSAVDARTEEAILASLRGALANKTGVIISHRVCAVRDCDHILVLEDGRVTAAGTHAELAAADGFYARIVREQGMDTP